MEMKAPSPPSPPGVSPTHHPQSAPKKPYLLPEKAQTKLGRYRNVSFSSFFSVQEQGNSQVGALGVLQTWTGRDIRQVGRLMDEIDPQGIQAPKLRMGGTPWKINMEHNYRGLEDHFPF